MTGLWSRLRAWLRPGGAETSARFGGPESFEGLENLRGLEIRARILADAMRAGSARSARRGAGIEPATVRAYSPGDDVRSIDWRVTARRGDLHVREFEEESDLDVLLMVDRSASLCGLGSDLAGRAVQETTAALALAAIAAGHRVGALFFTDSIEHYLAPSRARDQWRKIVSAALAPARGRGTDLALAVDSGRRTLTSRGLVVLMSDFVHGLEAVGDSGAIAALASRHDFVPIVVRTPSLEELPTEAGSVWIRDPETGRAVLAGARRAGAPPYERALALLRGLGTGPLLIDPRLDLGPQLRVRFGAARRKVA